MSEGGRLDPSSVSILVIDEAHHSVGSHAMGKSCDVFIGGGGQDSRYDR